MLREETLVRCFCLQADWSKVKEFEHICLAWRRWKISECGSIKQQPENQSIVIEDDGKKGKKINRDMAWESNQSVSYGKQIDCLSRSIRRVDR